jgi:predicted amidohydrolase YtcJ
MYTINGAYASFQERELGSLIQGKLADLVVLPENLLNCDPKALIDMKVIYTIVNGEIVYSAKEKIT